MTVLDTFLTALAAALIVGILIFAGIVCFLLSEYLPLGAFAPVLLILAGAAIGVFITLIICLGRKKPQG